MPAWTQAPYALPYIAANDVLEQTPTTNREQMKKVSEYLQQIAMPPGVIQAYVGTDAPDFWLLCDGSSYDPDKLPELSGVNADLHGDGVFRVPDLRGRSPIGATTKSDAEIQPFELGERHGDHEIPFHVHMSRGEELAVFFQAGGSPNVGWNGSTGAWGPYVSAPYDASNVEAHGHVYTPVLGVNFIIYAARPTKNVDLGQGAPFSDVTRRQKYEARLADPDTTEEERSMLEEQLASLS